MSDETPEEFAPAMGTDPFAVFRPHRGRAVALGLAAFALVLFGVVAVILPGPAEQGPWHVGDRIMFFTVGLALAFGFWRYASIRAVPTPEGLTVQNLLLRRTLTWPEIVGVQFGGGMPWPQLDLADTDTLAVMAIQRADGPERAGREASRLAALVHTLGEGLEQPPADDPPVD